MERQIEKKSDISDRYGVLGEVSGGTLLRDERKKRRMSRDELAVAAKISVPWLRQIEDDGEWPGEQARERIRAVLERCPICAEFKNDSHKLPVPADEKLYAKR